MFFLFDPFFLVGIRKFELLGILFFSILDKGHSLLCVFVKKQKPESEGEVKLFSNFGKK